MITINAIGEACPIPLIKAKKALQERKEGTIKVLVDNEIAVQNLEKMAIQMALSYVVEQVEDNNYCVSITKQPSGVKEIKKEEIKPNCNDTNFTGKIVVLLSSNKMGEGEELLGTLLIKGFLYALTQLEQIPDTVLLYNSGVFLSTQDSDAVEDLKQLEKAGTEILTCGTCLNHYGLSDQLLVGKVTNMYIIAEKMLQATKIIRP